MAAVIMSQTELSLKQKQKNPHKNTNENAQSFACPATGQYVMLLRETNSVAPWMVHRIAS